MNSGKIRRKKGEVEVVEVSPSTDLPPLVEGELRCFLVVTIGKLVWSSTTGVQKTPILPPYVRLRWWGEVSDGTYFKAQSIQNGQITKSRSKFGIRSGPKQMAAYLNDMGIFTFEVLVSMNSVPIGRIQIPNAISLTMRNPIRGNFPIFSSSSRRIGELYISLCFKDVKNAYYDTSESEYTSFDVSLNRSRAGSRKSRRLRSQSSNKSRSSSNGSFNSSKERSRGRKKRSTSSPSKEGRGSLTSSHKTKMRNTFSTNSSQERLKTDFIDTPRGIDDKLERNGQDLFSGNVKPIATDSKVVFQKTTSFVKPNNTVSSQSQFNKPLQDLLNQGRKLRGEINKLTMTTETTNVIPTSKVDKPPFLPGKQAQLQEGEVKKTPKELPQPLYCNGHWDTDMNIVDMVLNGKGLYSDYRPDLSRMSSVFSDMDDVLHEEEDDIFQQLFYRRDGVLPRPSIDPKLYTPKQRSTDEKIKSILEFSLTHVTVKNLEIFPQTEKKATKRKPFSRRQTKTSNFKQPLAGIYHVEYQLPSSKKSETINKPILTTSCTSNSGFVNFNQDANIQIELQDEGDAREWISQTLQFSVFRRKQNQTMTSCIGMGILPLSTLLNSETFEIDEEIEILEFVDRNSKLTNQIGTLQISLEIVKVQKEPPVKSFKHKQTTPKGDCLKFNEKSVAVAENLEKQPDNESNMPLQRYKPASDLQPSDCFTDTLNLYTSIGSAKNLPDVIMMGQEIGKVHCSNMYLVYRNIASNKISKSQICCNTSNIDFQFDQVTPVKIESDLFARLQNNFMVIEVWVKTCSNTEEIDDKLFGIIKVSLHPFYQSLKNTESARSVLQAHYPLISVDGYLPIVDPFTGCERGNLSVLLALGTNAQVSTLKKVRNEEMEEKRINILDSSLNPNNKFAGRSVHLHLDVIRISGLKSAAELIWRSDKKDINFKYCSEVGVNSYVILKTPFNNDKKIEQSKCVARSFCPNINHRFVIDLPLSGTTPLIQSLYDGKMELQVWHRPSMEDSEFTNDILLGSTFLPTSHLLSRSTEYKSWLTCSLPTSDHRKSLNVCSMEVRMSFKTQQDLDLVTKLKQPAWSPSPDLNRILSFRDNTLNEVFNSQDYITANVTVTSARLPKNILIQSDEYEINPRTHVYFRYKFFDHGTVTSNLCPISSLKRKGFGKNNKALLIKVAHMKSFLCRTSNSLLMYLREEYFEVETWLTNCRGDKHVKRPLECDILLGKALVNMNPILIGGLNKQQHMNGVFTLFKGGNEVFSDPNVSISLSFAPGNNFESESSELESFDEISKNLSSTLDCSRNENVSPSHTNIDESPEKLQNDVFFNAMVTVEKALHLNELFVQSIENVSSTSVQGCFVSYNIDSSDDIICTDVIKLSSMPIWNNTKEIQIKKLVLARGGMITFKVWQCNYDAHYKDNVDKSISQGDQMIGFASVDIAMLRVGFRTINGWYNILDFQGCCQGQLKIVITPTDSSNINIPILSTEKEYISHDSKSTNFGNLHSVPLLGPVHTPSGSMYMPGVKTQNDQTAQPFLHAVDSNENLIEKLQKQMKELDFIKNKFQQTQLTDAPIAFSLQSEKKPLEVVESDTIYPKDVLSVGNELNVEQNTILGTKSVHLSLFQQNIYTEDNNGIQSENECYEIEFLCPKSLNDEPLADNRSVSSLPSVDMTGHTTLWMSKSSSQLSESNNSLGSDHKNSEHNNENTNELLQFDEEIVQTTRNVGKLEDKNNEIHSSVSGDEEPEINTRGTIDQDGENCSKVEKNKIVEPIQEIFVCDPGNKDMNINAQKLSEEEIDYHDNTHPATGSSVHDNSVVLKECVLPKNLLENDEDETIVETPIFGDVNDPEITFEGNTDMLSGHLNIEPENDLIGEDVQPNTNKSPYPSLCSLVPSSSSLSSDEGEDKQQESDTTRISSLNNSSIEYPVNPSSYHPCEVNDTIISTSQTPSVLTNVKHEATILSAEEPIQQAAKQPAKHHTKPSNARQPLCFFPPNQYLVETMKAIQTQENVCDTFNGSGSPKLKVPKKPRHKFPPPLHLDADQTKRLARIFSTNYTSG